ncbi:MAG TPA: hypothetical protein VMI06_14205 [Terriglobia bacterium]|nr:hypothetical protein [Terriglobia bacterium]
MAGILGRLFSSVFGWISRMVRGSRTKHTRLDIDFGEVCFKREVVASLDAESRDCLFNVYVFLYVWAVNRMRFPTAIEKWKFSVAMGIENIDGEPVEDISTWRQHSKMGTAPDGSEEAKDIRKPVREFPARPLPHGIPSEGWVCFVIRGTKESWIENGTIQLTATDSSQHEHHSSRLGPWNCKGAMERA